jgi:hypothetical protein
LVVFVVDCGKPAGGLVGLRELHQGEFDIAGGENHVVHGLLGGVHTTTASTTTALPGTKWIFTPIAIGSNAAFEFVGHTSGGIEYDQNSRFYLRLRLSDLRKRANHSKR